MCANTYGNVEDLLYTEDEPDYKKMAIRDTGDL